MTVARSVVVLIENLSGSFFALVGLAVDGHGFEDLFGIEEDGPAILEVWEYAIVFEFLCP